MFLRVIKPFGKVKIKAQSGNKILSESICLKAAPGEMEKLTIKSDVLIIIDNEITVSLEELN